MAFDQSTRGLLQRFVSDARGVLETEFTRQLQNDYGLDPTSGAVTAMENLRYLSDAQRETARILRDTLAHYCSTPGTDHQSGLVRIMREQAFTVLNRLAALRMAEARGLLIESVGNGYQAKGFQLYTRLAGPALGEMGDAYRTYLFSVFDELAQDLPVLFHRYSSQGRLFPREAALLELIALINADDIAALWIEDETIGWIYQYFNSKEERKKMRDESAAPRDSRELAVRNQFFTPRYVVEFLTDNALGRIWYEMTRGQTRLATQCRYLIRRPDEQFLQPGEQAPEQPNTEGLSQEELLRQTVFIPHRPLKDPREIRMLDPACGSMHFGLYAFDLFEVIYQEAWEVAQSDHPAHSQAKASPAFVPFLAWIRSFKNHQEYCREIPRLIIEQNIHGIDIDPRAVQIAGLSLWLRAQRSWHEQGLRFQQRPPIRKSNIVCAEPMPGEEGFLDEFIGTHLASNPEQRLLGQLVRRVFEAMKLAGEAGSLLKIEMEIAESAAEAKQKWLIGSKPIQGHLFEDEESRGVQLALGLDVFEITDSSFWEQAEERIYTALQAYAERVEQENSYQRRLFAEDAARGFAFIDICRKYYDVALMNPPFGECSAAIKPYLTKVYKDNSVELYCAFTDRVLHLLHPGGLVGCITSSSFILYTDFSGFRELLLQQQRLEQLANLGDSVLDGAYVYTASYIIRKAKPAQFITFYDMRFEAAKAEKLVELVREPGGRLLRLLPPKRFTILASSPLCHWASDSLFSLVENAPSFDTILEDAGVGAAPQADFFNLWWEVPARLIGLSQHWVRIANGGAFSPFHRADYLVIDWKDNGRRAIADLSNRYPYLNGNVGLRIQRTHLYGRPGITYGKRTDRFNAQILAADQMFTFEGIGVFPKNNQKEYLLGILAYLNTRFVAYYLNLTAGLHKNDIYIRRLPFPLSEYEVVTLGKVLQQVLPFIVEALAIEEVHPLFSGTFLGAHSGESIRHLAINFKHLDRINEAQLLASVSAIEDSVSRSCGLDTEMLREVERDQGLDVQRSAQWTSDGPDDASTAERERPGFCRSGFEQSSDLFRYCINNNVIPSEAAKQLNADNFIEEETVRWFVDSIISYALGVSFGRWDIRYVTGEINAPELPDPFAPLPLCPPGQLQNEHRLPLTVEDETRIRSEGFWNYPIIIPWNGILLDDSYHHLDIEIRVRQVLEIIWKGCWETIEREMCEILGVRTIRDYLRKPTAFFADHLKRYSRSRRQAPIYWPLSTASGNYTLWIYYHRLNEQTLYTCINDFVEPKLRQVGEDLTPFRQSGAGRSRDEERRFEELQDLEQELITFRDELLRLAKLPWKPNLNDGVEISASPLWRFFRHKPWQKTLKETWDKLEKGEYDWAHLALTLWPDRVREKCKTDRSLAIAHGLEEFYIGPEPKLKKTRKRKTAEG